MVTLRSWTREKQRLAWRRCWAPAWRSSGCSPSATMRRLAELDGPRLRDRRAGRARPGGDGRDARRRHLAARRGGAAVGLAIRDGGRRDAVARLAELRRSACAFVILSVAFTAGEQQPGAVAPPAARHHCTDEPSVAPLASALASAAPSRRRRRWRAAVGAAVAAPVAAAPAAVASAPHRAARRRRAFRPAPARRSRRGRVWTTMPGGVGVPAQSLMSDGNLQPPGTRPRRSSWRCAGRHR